MSKVALYRLTKGGHSRREGGRFRRYKAGDEIILSPTEVTNLRGRVELVSDEVDDDQQEFIPQDESPLLSVETDDGPIQIELGESADKIQPPARRRGRPRKGA